MEEKRVLGILGWLLQLQGGSAGPYLLQLLVQATAPDMPQTDRQKWIRAAREGKVFPHSLQWFVCLEQHDSLHQIKG